MFTTLKTRLTATAVAASIALGAATAPAPVEARPGSSSSDELIAFLLGAAIMAVATHHGAGTPPPPAPPRRVPVHARGTVNLKQTYTLDLDRGRVGGPGTDIWFQAETRWRKFITPINGAMLAVGDGRNRGWRGCKSAAYSSRKIPLARLPEGTTVCVKTSAGRIAKFRINRILGGPVQTIRMTYTTWVRR